MTDCDARADLFQGKIEREEENKKYIENLANLRDMAEDYRKVLDGWTPPLLAEKTIVPDFSSGHYTAGRSWKECARGENSWLYCEVVPDLPICLSVNKLCSH